MESASDYHHAKALLDWQIELGATEAIGDLPVNRYEVPEKAEKPVVTQAPVTAPKAAKVDAVADARALAQAAGDLGRAPRGDGGV